LDVTGLESFRQGPGDFGREPSAGVDPIGVPVRIVLESEGDGEWLPVWIDWSAATNEAFTCAESEAALAVTKVSSRARKRNDFIRW
jgi:hypothetical protein